jgi:hypothetical protein
MPTLDSITIEVLNTLDQISIDPVESTSVIQLEENSTNLIVELSNVDPSSLVKSVNGKTGHVVIDYPDISSTPVNHVRYQHVQVNIPMIETSGPWEGYYIWTIPHNLNFHPSVTVFDSGDNLIEAYIDYKDINTAIIVMNSAISGYAYLS